MELFLQHFKIRILKLHSATWSDQTLGPLDTHMQTHCCWTQSKLSKQWFTKVTNVKVEKHSPPSILWSYWWCQGHRDSSMVATSSLDTVSGKRNWKTKTLVSVLTSCTNKQAGLVDTTFISWRWGVYWWVQILHRAEALPSITFVLSFSLFTNFAFSSRGVLFLLQVTVCSTITRG